MHNLWGVLLLGVALALGAFWLVSDSHSMKGHRAGSAETSESDAHATAAHGSEWGYEGAVGPKAWGSLDESYLLCSDGQTQSPINFEATAASGAATEFLLDYSDTPVTLYHNGHTIEVEYETGSFLELNGNLFELLQFHFHTPSEHTFASRSFPLEMHLVHVCGRCFFRSESGALAVVGVMIEEGEPNAAFARFWDHLPTNTHVDVPTSATLNIKDLLPDDLSAYHYQGSLTTPPCSEGVNWLMLQTAITLSAEQIQQFKSVLADTCCAFNNRPVQPLQGRTVEPAAGS